ncbi:MAG: hypothetical protein Ctma_0636 [Catillopecten margaritatus gill symbiont]|uniref:Uncharacterized protein n=1 Tax=Catillopecten margaritatus gill symbiont TaxID=3083288 RepID=A0AAU6PGP8_9GAMM
MAQDTNKKGYLCDEEGQKSSMRLMSMMSLIVAVLFSGIVVYKGDATDNVMIIIVFFLLAAFAPKAVQKFAEKKLN